MLHCPGAHLAWTWWFLSLVHLRSIDGGRPVSKQYPDAEYELLSAALHPDRLPDPDDVSSIVLLEPVDFALQFHGVNDADAAAIAQRFVDHVVEGRLSPVSDYRNEWLQLLWGTITLVTVGHPKGSA